MVDSSDSKSPAGISIDLSWRTVMPSTDFDVNSSTGAIVEAAGGVPDGAPWRAGAVAGCGAAGVCAVSTSGRPQFDDVTGDVVIRDVVIGDVVIGEVAIRDVAIRDVAIRDVAIRDMGDPRRAPAGRVGKAIPVLQAGRRGVYLRPLRGSDRRRRVAEREAREESSARA
jgi:hypothetical protein